jgi:TPR repeat protein
MLMPSPSLPKQIVILLWLALLAGVMPLAGQAPPAEMNPVVLMDVGPLPAPEVCGCVTKPFTLMRQRPGWGYGSGLAAPDTDATPSTLERRLQAQRDAEDRAMLPALTQDAFGGNPHASITLGWLFTTGVVKRDDTQAAAWFLLAAHQGHPDAYVQIGHRYLRGLGVEQDDRAAAYWLSVGAGKGDTTAMIALGGLYAAGRGVPYDWATAVAWWQKARHWRFIGDAYACGVGVDRDDERAARAYRTGADAGDAASSIQLAHMYASGCATPPTADTAHKMYKRVADEGYPEAQIGLSRMLLEGGGGGPPSPYEAYFWARLAELRLPAGELQSRARAIGERAARFMSDAEVKDADKFVASVIATGAEPMNR